MGDTGETDNAGKKGRTAYRKVWWMRFWLPAIAVGVWWFFASTAVSAYHLAKEGVVVSGVVTEVDRFSRTENNTVRFTTTDGRQIETTIAPKTCELKDPGATIQIRYVSSDPHNAQDTCDQARHDMSVGAGLGALGLTALSAQTWRLWLRHRKTGQLPPAYSG
ncbi:DUF3592 domain-containing protein [Actinoplanes sichuanensis]|uniref:DUF3592 domain-containing protein n=1 Tax=Actinoplanes sichuanensis TaxID=512349 RepID=A0ABW4AYV2_9ACTN|nr:DUF3592 domain-containing protein [Actinoplanes sichuanensis]